MDRFLNFLFKQYISLGLLTVDPTKRLTIKDLTRNTWLRGSSQSTAHEHAQLLLTPNILSQASRSLIVCIYFSKLTNCLLFYFIL